MKHLARDLRYAWRGLTRSPLFTLVALVSIALGIGAHTAIFTLVDEVLLRLLPVKNPQQLVLFNGARVHYGSNSGGNMLSFPMYEDFRDNFVERRLRAEAGDISSRRRRSASHAEARTNDPRAEAGGGRLMPRVSLPLPNPAPTAKMALGAVHGDVVWLVMREVLLLVGVGMAIGLLAAWALARFVSSQLYGISGTDPITVVGAAALLATVALLAGYVPARRATRVNPVLALRYE
jgi:hypothetical protein